MTTLALKLTKTLNEIKHDFAVKHCCENSPLYNSIIKLDWDKYFQLSMTVNEDDYLIHVDNDGYTMNHGNVGSQGIRYEFN